MSLDDRDADLYTFASIFGDGDLGSESSFLLSPVNRTMSDPAFVTLPAPITNPQPSPIGETDPPATSTDLPPPPIDGVYFDDQWHFDFLGDIEKIWEEYSGAGVHVGIYDDGLQYTHPDLDGTYDSSREVTVGGEVLDPDYYATWYLFPHGTSVAGLIGAEKNDFGTTGVAWGSSLTGVPIFYGPANINADYDAFIEAVDQTENFDIVNHSWGKLPFFWQHPVPIEQDAQLIAEWMEALEDGRDGLGTIIVKAAGNDNRNANGDGAATSRASIIVGAYDDDGDASYYSNFGSNLLVSAPSSGGPDNRGVVTTDVLGLDGGYNVLDENGQYTDEADYTNQFGGTSAATPIVTGVIALMLEANPNLGWRDVQNILAYSAREVGSGVGGERAADENDDWRYNGADNWNGGGLHYSEDYGFGSVDAYNAVRMSEAWHLFGGPQTSANETSYSSSATNVALDDLKTTDILFHFDGTSFDVESINISLNITHGSSSEELYFDIDWAGFLTPVVFPAYLTDLDITLISPDGTETTLADFNRDTAADNPADYGTDQWKSDFLANAFRGEDGIGTWTLRINDPWTGDSGTVNSATITLHGRDGDQVNLDDDVYHYTNEVFTTLGRDTTRKTLTDGNGGNDWLDMSAMSGNLAVNLARGADSKADGNTFLKIAATTDIENVVTGDGNDSITGNALNNKIHGMRGNDTIDGGIGNDTLSGGAGNDNLTGGIGADNFLFDRAFNASTNVDIIVDFSHLDDSFWLDNAIFSGLVSGALTGDDFHIGTSAEDMFDRIIYDSVTGALYYDADGSNSLFAQVQFATLANHPVDLSFNDFTVIATSPDDIVTTTDKTTTTDPTIVATDVDEAYADGSPIFGTEGGDTIRAKDANDRIFGFGGTDYIIGGAGDDYIDGGAGFDGIRGGEGNDTLIGGGSSTRWGDYLDGGEGEDLLIGSRDQINDNLGGFLGAMGDLLIGGGGNDRIYGFEGDDAMNGGAGNDIIDGGEGSDTLYGGEGDDRLIAGDGEEDYFEGGAGFDTGVLSGNYEDYRFYIGPYDSQNFWAERIGQSGEIVFRTSVNLRDMEALEFNDVTLDIASNPLMANVYDPADGTSVTFHGWEIGLNLFRAGTFDVYDDGPDDHLQMVNVINWNFGVVVDADITIHSDALTTLLISGLEGSVTVDAAAGERELTLKMNSAVFMLENAGRDLVSDNTATSIKFMSQFAGEGGGNNVNYFNGAAVNDYNFSFSSAETFRFSIHSADTRIQWYVPNVTTISTEHLTNRVGTIFEEGNAGSITIETALDDSLLATAGGSAEFKLTGHSQYGSELIRFGNLGDVNMSNDGTEGEEANTNVGLGLRGHINLAGGDDEARILGTDAFQGGTLDGGSGNDTLRMTFAVAAAIGNIGAHFSNFEILRLDTPTLTGKVVDVTNFESLDKILLVGASVSGGDNTIVNIVDGTTVTYSSGMKQNTGNYVYEIYDNQFGTTHFDMAGNGDDDTLNFFFGGYAIDSYSNGERPVGLDEGTVHVLDAETVNITTEAYDYQTFVVDQFSVPMDYLSYDPTDPFAQVLDLDATKTVTVTGETGWDFTLEGTDIGKVTLLDASGVTGTGAIGAVKATAQTNQAVTFIGGWGDDELTGRRGDDTLDGGAGGNDILVGGAGKDTAVFAGEWSSYQISINDGVATLAAADGTVDTVRGVELFKFADKTVTLANLLTGAVNEPPSVSLANVVTHLAENTPTTSRIKVADIVITDDGVGTNRLSLTGRDAAQFEIVGMALFLKAGAILDASKVVALEVAVAVDDDELAGTPDAVSGTYHLTIDDVPNLTMIHGTAGKQSLFGTAGNDYFDGHGGNDTFTGGKGDDTYVVDSAGDNVVETSGGGTDTVLSTISYTLGSNVENLTLIGTGAIDGTGNSESNVIIGNSGDNVLSGGNGDDALRGDDGDDELLGGNGNDAIDGGDGNDQLAGGNGDDALRGDDGDDELRSGNGEDTLDGGTGHDSLYGGSGRDRLQGGSGRDFLSGGVDRDTFVFTSIADSGTTSDTRDVIVDFSDSRDQSSRDVLDFTAIDADSTTADVNDDFVILRNAAGNKALGSVFGGHAGEMRFYLQAGQTIIEADIDGDAVADFSIALNGTFDPLDTRHPLDILGAYLDPHTA